MGSQIAELCKDCQRCAKSKATTIVHAHFNPAHPHAGEEVLTRTHRHRGASTCFQPGSHAQWWTGARGGQRPFHWPTRPPPAAISCTHHHHRVGEEPNKTTANRCGPLPLYISLMAANVRIRWVGEVMRCCWLHSPLHHHWGGKEPNKTTANRCGPLPIYISLTAASVRIRWVGEVMRCCYLPPALSPMSWEEPNKTTANKCGHLPIYFSYGGECQNQVGWRSNEVLLAPAHSITTK